MSSETDLKVIDFYKKISQEEFETLYREYKNDLEDKVYSWNNSFMCKIGGVIWKKNLINGVVNVKKNYGIGYMKDLMTEKK